MGAATLEPLLVERLAKLKAELPYFARHVLKIRAKSGEIGSLTLNRGQLHLHAKLEEQRRATGKVRAVIVKGRQLGISTYLQGRFYHRLWSSPRALRAFILTHEQAATDNLFGMAQRFHHHHEPGFAKPPLARSNAKELRFSDNDCGYQVSTAGSKETGRSATFQLFHGSEVAFWPSAEDHVQASLQAVSDTPGTEIILESTANGVGNLFHRQAMAAVRQQSDFIAVFVPWFWGEDYQRKCPDGFEPGKVWLEYARAHGLTWEQLYWAWAKNRDLAATLSQGAEEPCWKFKQEFPATLDEAFQSSGDSFIPAEHVLRARRPKEPIIGRGPVILGVDPARSGDKVGIIDRCGRRMGERIAERMDPGGSVIHVAVQVARIIDRLLPDAVNIDVGSNGAGVYDWLLDKGYGRILNAVNFGSSPLGSGPTGDDLYFNRRAEMYDLLRVWLADPLGVQIPDDDGLHADLVAAKWGPAATRYNTSNELILEEKAKIKERLGASPDLADAAALTFAVPFAAKAEASQTPRLRRTRGRSGY